MKGYALAGIAAFSGALVLIGVSRAQSAEETEPVGVPPLEVLETSLPGDYIQMTEALLGHGMGDPRGLELRKVVFETMPGNASKRQTKTAAGWITSDGKEVLLQNGCFYKVVQNVGPAEYSDLLPARSMPPMFRIDSSMADHTQVLPALLYAAGQAELADRVEAPIYPGGPINATELVSTYVRSRLQQAQQLTLEGSDAKALNITEQIARIRPLTERQETTNPTLRLAFESARELKNDLSARQDGTAKEFAAGPGQDPHIADLINQLADASQFPVDRVPEPTWQHPALAGLIKAGPKAVPTMLAAYKSDIRLTRLRNGNNPNQPEQGFISVKMAIDLALSFTLHLGTLPRDADGNLDEGRVLRLAKAVESGSLGDAWILMLAEETATKTELEGIARAMVQSVDQSVPAGPNTIIGKSQNSKRRIHDVDPETRIKIADLLAERIEAMLKQDDEAESAITLAIALAYANGKDHYALLSDATDAGLRHLARGGHSLWPRMNTPRLIAARYEAGDPHVLMDAEQLLKVGGTEDDNLIPLWLARNDPAWSSLRVKAFLDEDSPFSLTTGVSEMSYWNSLTSSRLFDVPEFVEAFAQLLDNKQPFGRVSVNRVQSQGKDHFSVHYNRTKGGGGSQQMTEADMKAAASAESLAQTEMRVCDYAAIFLNNLEGKPAFVPTWSVEKRDAALRDIKQYMLNNKSRMEVLWKPMFGWPTY